jgi:hypothetical protein
LLLVDVVPVLPDPPFGIFIQIPVVGIPTYPRQFLKVIVLQVNVIAYYVFFDLASTFGVFLFFQRNLTLK